MLRFFDWRNLGLVAGVVILGLCGLGQIGVCQDQTTDLSKTPEDIQKRATPADESHSGTDPNVLPGNPAKPAHAATLSWKASTPASTAPGDVVIGYMVYRSSKPHDPNALPLNPRPIASTTYIDATVQAGGVYYYVTRAVSKKGTMSLPSTEIRVEVPR